VAEAAFFDLDKTVIARASIVAFGRPFYREGLISRRTILRGLYGQLIYLYMGADEAKIARMRASMLDLTRGWDQTRVQEIVEDALERTIEPIIYAEALELIAHHRAAGRTLVIVSASPEEIVKPLARHLGIEQAIASRAKLDSRGRYTGEMDYDAFGPAKADAMCQMALELELDLNASYAYSDSATDLPMLEAVGHPVVVNPDRELMRIAQDRGWEVRHFVRPVRLRDRVPMPHPGLAAAAGAVIAATGGALVWWRLSRRVPSATARYRRPLGGAAAMARDGAARQRKLQSTRSFLAARTPRVMRTASSRSFFMPGRVLPPRGRRSRRRPSPPRRPDARSPARQRRAPG
jgi:HAD superfamily hydrolase (TIGR01490 family)